MNTLATHHADACHCANCCGPVSGNYCQKCGQETLLHPPSAREFLHEFVGHYVALEGKLWRSLALLLFRPGRLTREYLEGRRVRYIQPLRLYLTFSIIFFALFRFSGIEAVRLGSNDSAARTELVTPGGQSDPDAPKAAGTPRARAAPRDEASPTLASVPEVRGWATALSPALGAKVDKFLGLPKDEMARQLTKGFYSYVPYALFLLMPLFAFWLKLFYLGSGRRYGEHLLFALHANAFAFAMLALLVLTPAFLGPVQAALVLWLALWLPMAMRRVYGGGRLLTGWRWIMLMLLHLVSIGLAIAAAAALAVIA